MKSCFDFQRERRECLVGNENRISCSAGVQTISHLMLSWNKLQIARSEHVSLGEIYFFDPLFPSFRRGRNVFWCWRGGSEHEEASRKMLNAHPLTSFPWTLAFFLCTRKWGKTFLTGKLHEIPILTFINPARSFLSSLHANLKDFAFFLFARICAVSGGEKGWAKEGWRAEKWNSCLSNMR